MGWDISNPIGTPDCPVATATGSASFSGDPVDPAGVLGDLAPGEPGPYQVVGAVTAVEIVVHQNCNLGDLTTTWALGGWNIRSVTGTAPAGWTSLTGQFQQTRDNGITTIFSWRLTTLADQDHDGIPDTEDPCPSDPQNDCGTDRDNDGTPDETDPFPDDPSEWLDTDGDGTGDNADTDDDSDSTPDETDAFPLDPTESKDSDGDGAGDNTDADDDNDGVLDADDPAPTDPSIPGGVGCDTPPVQDPVTCYAPLVKLHPLETHFPLGVRAFLANSKLKWAHDQGCPDRTLANEGEIDFLALGHGGYTRQQANRFCVETGAFYASDQLTRPSQKSSNQLVKPAGLSINEGFFLDLNNDLRHGLPPLNHKVLAPVTYSYDPGNHVTYWFMYGFNPGPAGLGPITRRVDRHEGEWERITVRLNPDNTARQVEYFQHECPAEPYLWQEMVENQYLEERTHPVVYAANGSHASFPEVLSIGLDGACAGQKPLQGVGDHTLEGGPAWETWNVPLIDAAAEPWYGPRNADGPHRGFGGAWGEVATTTGINTGPLGPPWKDPSSDGFN